MSGPAMAFLALACMAAYVAYDAFRVWDVKRLVLFTLATIIASGCAGVSLRTAPSPDEAGPPQNRLQREFGPDWDCSSGAFCIRKPKAH